MYSLSEHNKLTFYQLTLWQLQQFQLFYQAATDGAINIVKIKTVVQVVQTVHIQVLQLKVMVQVANVQLQFHLVQYQQLQLRM